METTAEAGTARRREMTYGVMPTREEFDAACLEHDPEDPPEACVALQGFAFGNGDPRLGEDRLTADELWEELQRAYADFEDVLDLERPSKQAPEAAGDWISDVLGCLGFRWV